MNLHISFHREVMQTDPVFGRVIVLRGTSTDLIAMLEIERGEGGRRGANRFADAPTIKTSNGGAK